MISNSFAVCNFASVNFNEFRRVKLTQRLIAVALHSSKIWTSNWFLLNTPAIWTINTHKKWRKQTNGEFHLPEIANYIIFFINQLSAVWLFRKFFSFYSFFYRCFSAVTIPVAHTYDSKWSLYTNITNKKKKHLLRINTEYRNES